MGRSVEKKLGLAAAVFFGFERTAAACSVCFGDPRSKMTHGTFVAMVFLLGVVLFVLSGIAWTAMTWASRAKHL